MSTTLGVNGTTKNSNEFPVNYLPVTFWHLNYVRGRADTERYERVTRAPRVETTPQIDTANSFRGGEISLSSRQPADHIPVSPGLVLINFTSPDVND